jgi:hypothetical protein
MGLIAWLLGLLGDEAATSAAGRVTDLVAGDAAERAVERALRNACQVVAQDVADSADVDRVAAVLFEHLAGAAPMRLAARSALADLEAAVSNAVGGLWTEVAPGTSDVTHAEAIGLASTHDELVRRLVDELIASLGVVSAAASPIGALVALLGTERNRREIAALRGTATNLARAGAELQATWINAWVAVNEDVPVVYVMNDSDAPIFDARPTPALIGYGDEGEIAAQVGHSPLDVVRQIDPHSGWAWPMNHCPGWGGVPYVRGQVHLNSRDASDQSWLLAHDRLVPQRDPWDPTPS